VFGAFEENRIGVLVVVGIVGLVVVGFRGGFRGGFGGGFGFNFGFGFRFGF